MKPREYRYLGEGRHRAAFLTPSGNFVIKVPIDEMGFVDNFREYRMWRQIDKWMPKEHLARCKLHQSSGILVMEAVDLAYEYPVDGTDWIGFIDCGQVGYNRRGRLVAYDYA